MKNQKETETGVLSWFINNLRVRINSLTVRKQNNITTTVTIYY